MEDLGVDYPGARGPTNNRQKKYFTLKKMVEGGGTKGIFFLSNATLIKFFKMYRNVFTNYAFPSASLKVKILILEFKRIQHATS